jgi:hypothetical protein
MDDELSELRASVAALTQRVAELEDRAAVAEVLARYGPSADSGIGPAVARLWTEEGVFNVPGLATWTGHDEIAGMIEGPGHQGLVVNGVAHFLSAPRIEIDGDRAVAQNHALNIRWEAAADRFWVARASANVWRLERTDDGWKITSRESRTLDGDDAAPALFR